MERSAPSRRNGEAADGPLSVHQTDESSSESLTSSIPDSQFQDVVCGSWQDAPNWKCHASFGDQRTTATVGAFGQLLQFSSFLDAGSSGMFSADHSYVEEPCLTSSRASSLQELSEQPFHFGPDDMDQHYGLNFPNLTMNPRAQPRLTWTFWRWPRYTYPLESFKNFPNLKLSIQWMVHKNIVLQQCLLENVGDDEIHVDVMFYKSMLIRDLDHLDWEYKFNEEGSSNHDIRSGPKGHSCVFVHKLDAYSSSEGTPATDVLRRLHRSETISSEDPDVQEERARPPVPWSSQGVHGDPFAGSSSRSSRLEGGSEPFEPLHENTLSDNSNPSKKSQNISVISSVTIDGIVKPFEDETSPEKWSFVVNGRLMAGRDARARTVEVTTAYRMRILDPKPNSQTQVIPSRKMNVDKFLRKEQSTHLESLRVPDPDEPNPLEHNDGEEAASAQMEYFPRDPAVGIPGTLPSMQNSGTPQAHLGFAAARNLEHILSVCTIQATPKACRTTVESLPQDLRHVEAVAITCGDMSGHLICWSASFFAFRFLVAFHRILRASSKGKHASILRRIERTCLGHLKWLHLIQPQSSGQRFGGNYWVQGKLVVGQDVSTLQVPGHSFLDTGFQILKVASSTELCASNDTTAELMSEWAPSWLDSMKRSDKQRKYVWPHTDDEYVNTFRLDEHVWIWRALKSLERNDHQAWLFMAEKAPESSSTSTRLSKDNISKLRKVLAPDTFRSEVCKRFTTKNDFSRRPMLAVTRSATETRFLLHSRDTALFYKEMPNFYEEDKLIQGLWERTVEFQRYHDIDREGSWENPLRHALCILMGTQGLTTTTKPPDDSVCTATELLFRSCSPNGFFPGGMPLFNKEHMGALDVSPRDRGFYYHASFEIPYILLTRAREVCKVYTRRRSEGLGSRPQFAHNERHVIPLQGDDAEQRQVLETASNFRLRRLTAPYHDSDEAFGNFRPIAKKAFPVNGLIDPSNIVTVEDEWLYPFPEFFMRESTLNEDDYYEALAIIESRIFPTAINDKQDEYGISYIFEPELGTGFWPCEEEGLGTRVFRIFDVKSSKLMKSERRQLNPVTVHLGDDSRGYDYGTLWNALSPARTVQASKKRLVHFDMASKEAASICLAATEPSDRSNLLDFFERHSRYENYASDQCSMVYNSWETELHVTYHQLVDGFRIPRPGLPANDCKPFPGRYGKKFCRAMVSLRFKGDFSDRYWTCYMLEHTQNEAKSTIDLDKTMEHRQRKVLEQQYFLDLLINLIGSTEDILKEAEHCLGVKSGLFTTPMESTKEYLSWSGLWQSFEPFLQTLDDDLASTQVTIDQWEAREKDRGVENPRWTRNDERKYRGLISQIRRETKHQMSKMKQLHANIKSMRERCSERLVKAREDLNFRSGQSTLTFTYVTVVFLPLGFATSIFSMNGSPDTSLAINMVVASAIAFAITILALMNAKSLMDVLRNVLESVHNSLLQDISTSLKILTENAKKSSVMVSNRQEMENKGISPNGSNPKPPHLRASSTDPMSWSLVFWMNYLFLELPSRSITSACRALGWPQDDDKVAILERTSMESRHEPMAQLVADDKLLKDEYTIRIARVLLGIIMIPVFLPTWILQIVCFNAWDALALLGEMTRQGLNHISLPENDGFESSLMAHLTKPPERMRPMKIFKNHLQSKKEPQKVQRD